MKLYFSPLACSMATRISLYEAGATAELIEVEPSDAAYARVNPLGQVPALVRDDGSLLTENAAILQYVADRFPEANLAPRDAEGRTRLQQWLSFIGTELHKVVFGVLVDKEAPPEAKKYAVEKAQRRLDWLAAHVEGRDTLLDRFSVADAYLLTVLNWSVVTPIDLKKWPAIERYVGKMRARPSVAKAMGEEMTLYARRQA
jgi:glutathione S-transferase